METFRFSTLLERYPTLEGEREKSQEFARNSMISDAIHCYFVHRTVWNFLHRNPQVCSITWSI